MTEPARFLSDRIGLRVDGITRTRLDGAVRDVARAAGCPAAALGPMLDEDPSLAQELIDRVTVQETGFFRHPEQFALLAEHLRAQPAPGVVWSAGCANGQEPWSVAMLLEEQGLAGWTVLATDVSVSALDRARQGVYSDRELRGLSELRRRRFVFGESIAPRLRERVRFLHHNLATSAPPAEAGRCGVVLCRNVLIYLHRPAIDAFLDGLRARMPGGALLLVGMGEAVGPLDGFRPAGAPGALLRGSASSVAESGRAPLPPLSLLLDEGRRKLDEGDLEAAALCFRQAGFLEPEDPRPPERLAAVLEAIARQR